VERFDDVGSYDDTITESATLHQTANIVSSLVTCPPSRSQAKAGHSSLALAFVGLFLFALLFLALLLSGWLARTGAAGWFARTNLRTTRRGNLSRTEVRSVWCRVGWTPVYGVEVFVRLGVR
jgi:hypothetical protein